MFLPPLQLPLISAGRFGAVIGRMLDFVSLRVRRSDQGMTPSLSPGLRAQTVALHRRLTVLTREFHRLARLACEGRLRVYPDRRSPVARSQAELSSPARRRRPEPASPFGPSAGVAGGPTLPALPTSGFGWMLGFVPAMHRDELAGLLRHPEMVALIGASSSVARMLRSLCYGLSVARPEGVFPAQRRRGPRAAPRSRPRARLESASTDSGGGIGPGGATRRAPCIVMSAQARDRWWAERRGAARPASDAQGAGTPARGGCAKS